MSVLFVYILPLGLVIHLELDLRIEFSHAEESPGGFSGFDDPKPNRRLTMLLNMSEEDNKPPTAIGLQEFLTYCQTKPHCLFEIVLNHTVKYLNEIKRRDDQIMDLIEERDRYQTAFAEQALNRHRIDSPAPTTLGAPEAQKTAKIPDPPILTDGKDPQFDDWLLRIRSKLDANHDHFPTPALRLAYVQSRCGGNAAKHLLARSQPDSPMRYQDAEDILNHLKTIYQDVNQVINAKHKFRTLKMKPSDQFQDFLSEFTYLAQESQLSEAEWKEELFHRLTPYLQTQVIRESDDSTIQFTTFAQACARITQRLDQIQANRRSNSATNSSANSRGPSRSSFTSPNAMSGSPRTTTSSPSPANQSPRYHKMTDELRAQLMSEGKCFYCKEPGHISATCPTKKKALALKALEHRHQHQDQEL